MNTHMTVDTEETDGYPETVETDDREDDARQLAPEGDDPEEDGYGYGV
jgi:hypothetical protein